MVGAMRVSLFSVFMLMSAAVFAQTSTESPMPGRLVVGMVGGLLGQELRGLIDAYAKPLGVETVYVEGTTNDLLAKVRAQKGNPQIDLFIGNDRTFALAKSLDLIEKLDPRLVPNLARVHPKFKDPDGYGQFFEVNTVGIAYRTDKFKEAGIEKPTSWRIYTDPALRGRGILFPPTVSFGYYFLIGLAMGDGKDERDMAPAWSRMEQVVANKPVVVPSPGQAEAIFERGEGWMYVIQAVRAKLARDQGAPIGFAIPKEGTIVLLDFLAPVKGAKNQLAAQRVINHLIGKDIQTKRARDSAVAPVNMDVEMTAEIKATLGFEPDKPVPNLYVPDVAIINKNLDAWVDQFNRAVSR
jgi:putative spermidine/putrescine transport system substrate-binding protein